MGEKEHFVTRTISIKLRPAVVAGIFLCLTTVLGVIFKSFLAASLFMGVLAFGWLVIAGINKLEGRYRCRHPLRCHKWQLAKLLAPDWGFYGRHLGREVPGALQSLYRDERRISRLAIPVPGRDYAINCFVPVSQEELLEAEPYEKWPQHSIVPLATTDLGDPIYLKPGPAETNAVWISEHELQESYILAESPEEFIATIFPDGAAG